MIQNFITLLHANDRSAQYEGFIEKLSEQIAFFYPDAWLHVLTNKKRQDRGNMVHHVQTLDEGNFAKFQLFGLLDEPAMYLDADIVMWRPFERCHLKTSLPFNLYKTTRTYDLDRLATWPIGDKYKSVPQFNNGIIWIPEPSRKITNELIAIWQTIFNLPKKFDDKYATYNNDEHAVSYYVAQKNWTMKIFPEVNALRGLISEPNPRDFQTVHYWAKTKHMLDPEYERSKAFR